MTQEGKEGSKENRIQKIARYDQLLHKRTLSPRQVFGDKYGQDDGAGEAGYWYRSLIGALEVSLRRIT